ncbi:hypothetical protein FRC07_014893 [Ceratobasidium sp. 392]|nr:hypothetical protein FRC07_014893 [Ceratobasidium sp. 392]
MYTAWLAKELVFEEDKVQMCIGMSAQHRCSNYPVFDPRYGVFAPEREVFAPGDSGICPGG